MFRPFLRPHSLLARSHAARAVLLCTSPTLQRPLIRRQYVSRQEKPPQERANDPSVGGKHLRDFDLADGVFVVTGGGRGLGLNLAEALCEAGAEGKQTFFGYLST